MLISTSHRFLFFHVAKVAGLSMREALREYASEPEVFNKVRRPPRVVGGQPNRLYAMWESITLHAQARQARKALPDSTFSTFYKFAFVRNPWDWQLSMYHFILKKTDHIRHAQVKDMAGFEEYMEWVVNTDNPFAMGATKLQTTMLMDEEGHWLVDYIGRYENLARDFSEVMSYLGLDDVQLPSINQSRTSRDYQAEYTPYTRRLVEIHFQEDIEALGYQYDGVSEGFCGLPRNRPVP